MMIRVLILASLAVGLLPCLWAREAIDHVELLDPPLTFTPFHEETMTFEQPVWFSPVPGFARVFVVLEHQTGKAWLLHKSSNNNRKTLFADWGEEVSDGSWEGLMCLAFHPDFNRNRRFFIKHETLIDEQLHTVIVEKRAAANFLTDSGEVSKRLLAIKQPADNHNGGTLAFGPDGFLYIGMGDGDPQEDPKGYSQSGQSFLGKILRLDVDKVPSDRPYGIPADNPFIERDAWRPEIWAVGFREPWRFSFDRKTGELWLGDVGQVRFEEILIARSSENHGWNVREGWAGFKETYRREGETYAEPLLAYSRHVGGSVTGGYVYRGTRSPSFQGVYLFGDFNTRRMFGLRKRGGKIDALLELGTAPEAPASFGQDEEGELYMVGYGGTIYHIDLSKSTFPEQRPLAQDAWAQRPKDVRKAAESVMGSFPNEEKRIALDVRIEEEVDMGSYLRRLISYQSEPDSRTPAYLCIPKKAFIDKSRVPAILCLHPTDNQVGHQVVVGLAGKEGRQYASELAERGFVTLAPAYPLLANYWPNLSALGYESGAMKAIWDNSRGLDLLESLPYVNSKNGLAAIGHSLGGHNAIFSAVFDDRIQAAASSCGFDAFADYYDGRRENWYYGKGWCQLRYMPRLSNYRDRLQEIPFDFPDLLSSLAPRKIFINAPLHDSNFRWKSVQRCAAIVQDAYKVHQRGSHVIVRHPDTPHDFVQAMRKEAYEMIESVLGKP